MSQNPTLFLTTLMCAQTHACMHTKTHYTCMLAYPHTYRSICTQAQNTCTNTHECSRITHTHTHISLEFQISEKNLYLLHCN